MTTSKKTPTTRELVAARQAQAPAKAQPATPKTTAVARTDNRDYQTRYLDEIAPSGIVGRRVKFSKDATFVTHDDGEEVPKDAEFAALCDQTLFGWMKFNGAGEAPESRMGLYYDGFVMPPREELDELDKSKWEIGLNGAPDDPWQHHMYVVLQNIKTDEMFTFDTSSKTGRRAVGNLLRHYNRMIKMYPGEVPVVWLRVGGYNHSDSRVGWVDVPVFVPCGHRPADSVAKPDTSTAGFLNEPPLL